MNVKCNVEQVMLKPGYFLDYESSDPLDVLEVKIGRRGLIFNCRFPNGETEWFYGNELEFV